jgi:hypothetical protein
MYEKRAYSGGLLLQDRRARVSLGIYSRGDVHVWWLRGCSTLLENLRMSNANFISRVLQCVVVYGWNWGSEIFSICERSRS